MGNIYSLVCESHQEAKQRLFDAVLALDIFIVNAVPLYYCSDSGNGHGEGYDTGYGEGDGQGDGRYSFIVKATPEQIEQLRGNDAVLSINDSASRFGIR